MACDMASVRVRGGDKQCSKYWWSEEIADLRRVCIAARRGLTRARKRNDLELVELKYASYRDVRRQLRVSIKKAKIEAWNELIAEIDEDPWGLPFKMVLGKIRRPAPMLTETLKEDELDELLKSFFPLGETHDPIDDWSGVEVPVDGTNVSPAEVRMALKKGNANKTPGGWDNTWFSKVRT